MSLLAEEQWDEPTPPTSATSSPSATTSTATPTSGEAELLHRAAWRAAVIGTFSAAATILAVRFILLLAVIGALGLTWIAAQGGAPMQLGAVGLYTGSVVLPLVWLASRR